MGNQCNSPNNGVIKFNHKCVYNPLRSDIPKYTSREKIHYHEN